MKIKKYFAADSREALRLVREEQGPEAMIIANRRVAGGVEIIAALDYDEQALRRVEAGSEAAAVVPGAVRDPALTAMRQELDALRGLLESRLGQFGAAPASNAELRRRLEALGLGAELVGTLLAEVPDGTRPEQAWPLVQAGLAQRIAVTDDDILTHGGVIALVGPTGVGKTTMIAKLAARYALRHGKRHVALVSADDFRIGAGEQLQIYGRLLGVPVYGTEDGRSLDSLLDELAAKHLVLIDTAGTGQRDLELAARQAALYGDTEGLKTYLVLAANVQPAVLAEVAERFARQPLAGCLITKIDEAASLGEVLDVVVRRQLPVAYLGDGQRVPEDLHPARAAALVARAAALAQSAAAAAATSRKQAYV